MRTAVSLHFRQLVLQRYPALIGNEPFIRFFQYLCFGTFFDPNSHRLVIPTTLIAEQFYQVAYTRHFNGKAVLEQFRNQVLPGLDWSDSSFCCPDSWSGKAREIVDTGFHDDIREALRQECLDPSQDQVDFVTGLAHQRAERYKQAAQETSAHQQELAKLSLNATQAKISGYLHGSINAGHLFLRKLRDNQTAISNAIEQLPEEIQGIQLRILANVQRNPNIYYLPSAKGNTCRLSARGDSILGLKKAVRQAATKGWVECDLRSSQFSILAAKLEAPVSHAFISSGKSIWQEFYRHVSGVDGDPPADVKAVLKKAMYSLCFGKSKSNLKEFLGQHGMAPLLKHPILCELLLLRRKWFQEIKNAGGASDVWGVWHGIDHAVNPETGKKRWAGGIAATIIQAVEMEIIAPIFEVAMMHGKSDQFRICLFQHDGATLSFQSQKKQARAQAKLTKAVEKRAAELGVTTVLEFTQL